MSTIQNLKKAHQAQAVTKDTTTLEKFLIKNEQDGKARLTLVGIESKYVPKYDNTAEGGSLGYRTRFLLENGDTIGTFSNAAFSFFQFFAGLMGHGNPGQFLHIDIKGRIVVEVSTIALDQKRSTYNFEIIEEGSDLQGFADYLPTADTIMMLGSGESVNTETGEITEAEPKSKK